MNSMKSQKRNYTISEKVKQMSQNRIKQFTPTQINQNYYYSFKSKFELKETSWRQYKVDVQEFLNQLNNKDFANISVRDIEKYAENSNNEKTKNNKKAHIRSMMLHIVKNDVNNAVKKVSKEMLVYLLGKN